jgi:broad specificity phosphatase PhoE
VGDRTPDVWTSTLRRATATAEALGRPFRKWKALDEIDAGACDGLTYAEVRARFPEEYALRGLDKLRYRYPRGESYEDVMDRLEPVLLELERQRTPVLVISHQAVLRALYGYFTNAPLDRIPHLSVPLHTVIELTPKAYGTDERRFPLGPGVADSGAS